MLEGLWAQFTALGSTLLLLFALSKLPFVHVLWRRNVTEPFGEWVDGKLGPLHEKVDRTDRKLHELAMVLDYEFKNNGGNSLRDRVDEAVQASGGQPAPS